MLGHSPHTCVLGHDDTTRGCSGGKATLVGIVGVDPRGPVLILDLAEDDGTTMLVLTGRNNCHEVVKPAFDRTEIARIINT